MSLTGLISAVGLALLGVLATRHIRKVSAASPLASGRDPVALPLALLTWDLAVWNLATTLYGMTGEPLWHWIDVSFSPFTPPLVLHLVLAFTGSARRLRHVLRVAFALYALLAASSACAPFADWARAWVSSGAWSIVFLAGWLPIMLLCLVLLLQTLRRSRDVPLAAMRARLILAALVVAGVLADRALGTISVQVPSLGVLGTFGAMLLMAAVVLRFHLFVGTTRRTLVVYTLTLAVVTVSVLAFLLSADVDVAPLLVLVLAVLALVALAVREVVKSGADRRARDLPGEPRAFLGADGARSEEPARRHERRRAVPRGVPARRRRHVAVHAEHHRGPDMLALVAQAIDRSGGNHRRSGASRASRSRLPSWPRMRSRATSRARSSWAARGSCSGSTRRPQGPWLGDRDLVASALENLVKNALDAMPDGGRLDVRTRKSGDVLVFEVEDQGGGIDPRYLEHVADDFFTTKADGDGLGLAFISVAAAPAAASPSTARPVTARACA